MEAVARWEQLRDGSWSTGKGLMQAGNRETGPRCHINASFVVRTTWKSSDSTAKPKINKNKKSYFLSIQFLSVLCVFYDSESTEVFSSSGITVRCL